MEHIDLRNFIQSNLYNLTKILPVGVALFRAEREG